MTRVLTLALALAASAGAQPIIATAQYDNQRTGANPAETVLTPRAVASPRFGKLFTIPVDGDVYAQPLYFPRLEIPGKGGHDVLFVATEHDSVYAFDAGGQPAEPLWHVSFVNPTAGVNPVPDTAMSCRFISPEVGITSTPVIDPASRTLYVLVRTEELGADRRPRYFQRLHALDLATGAERTGSPALIRGSVTVPGWFGLFSKEVNFHALLENPRAALLLAGGNVYLSWGSACDVMPYYGWVESYDARTLKPNGVFNTAPDAGETGIWQSDAGIAADAEGAVYAITGNGKFDAASGGRDYGDSVIKLAQHNGALTLRDYFTPSDEAQLNAADGDFGSGGPVLLPDQAGAHPHLLVACGKGGLIYLIDRDRMGGYRAGASPHAVQRLQAGTGTFGAPACWNGRLFYANRKDTLREIAVQDGKLTTAHQGTQVFDHPGAIPAVSSNGAKDGVVWLVDSAHTSAILHAYDAADVSRELYSAVVGQALHFAMVTVANGRVYIGESGVVYVYGLRGAPAAGTKFRANNFSH